MLLTAAISHHPSTSAYLSLAISLGSNRSASSLFFCRDSCNRSNPLEYGCVLITTSFNQYFVHFSAFLSFSLALCRSLSAAKLNASLVCKRSFILFFLFSQSSHIKTGHQTVVHSERGCERQASDWYRRQLMVRKKTTNWVVVRTQCASEYISIFIRWLYSFIRYHFSKNINMDVEWKTHKTNTRCSPLLDVGTCLCLLK